MPAELTRIFSDVHFGDRASRVRSLHQIRPLFSEADHVVLNGDTLDTRPGPRPDFTAACRAQVGELLHTGAARVTALTGNHDPDLSDTHWLSLADGEVLVMHGDVLFDDIVPWGRDSGMIRRQIAACLAPHSKLSQLGLAERFAIWRKVAVAIPQRHQSERHPLKYALHFAADTLWPPTRLLRVFSAWRSEPMLAGRMVRAHHPRARFVLLGHTHRPSIRRLPDGLVVINTGSFSPPLGGYTVDLRETRLVVRRTLAHAGDFRPGPTVAEFPLGNGQ